jgi:hypothetical protein
MAYGAQAFFAVTEAQAAETAFIQKRAAALFIQDKMPGLTVRYSAADKVPVRTVQIKVSGICIIIYIYFPADAAAVCAAAGETGEVVIVIGYDSC